MKSSNVIKRITLIKDLRKGFQSAFNLHFTKPEAKRKKEAKKREVLLVSFSNFAHFVFAIIHAPNIVQRIIKKSPFKNWENHKHEAYHEDLAVYISSSKNFNFIFSTLYAIFLATNAFCQLEYHSFLFSADIDNAILKSFLVFLAFTAMKQKSKNVDINTKDLLKKIIGLFSHDEQTSNNDKDCLFSTKE